MDTRYHFFLTVVIFSVFTGYALHDFSTDNMSDFHRVTDIDIADSKVKLHTGCIGFDIPASDQSLDDLEKAAYQREIPYGIELFETTLTRNSEIDRIEITEEGGLGGAVIVIDDDSRFEVDSITGLILAAKKDIPVYVEDELVREEGYPTCLDQSLEL